MPSNEHSRSLGDDFEAGGVRMPPERGTLSSRSPWTSASPENPPEEHEPPIATAINGFANSNIQTVRHDAESQSPRTLIAREEASGGPVTWSSLPRKHQLAILFLARFVDFLHVTSLQAYAFYQIKDFDREALDARISQQAGLLQGCFTGAQVVTAILWGKAADARWCGRKWVLVVGLGGTAVSCLGYGLSTTFFWAALWRAFGGAVNGTVGIMQVHPRPMPRSRSRDGWLTQAKPHDDCRDYSGEKVSVPSILDPPHELQRRRHPRPEYEPPSCLPTRGYILTPSTVMGGMLADPGKTLPGLFGDEAVFGFQWIQDYPYALPSLMNCIFLTIVTAVVFLFLEETSKERGGRFDYGLYLGNRIRQAVFGNRKRHGGYAHVHARQQDNLMGNLSTTAEPLSTTRRLPFHRVWTRNVLFTLLTSAFYDFHLGAFTNIWSLFLSTPRYLNAGPSHQGRGLPLLFTGGLGMPASTVGLATSFLGILGMLLQATLYPPIQARLGTLRSFRYFLFLFPVAYFVAPYLSILPSSTEPPDPADGGFIWVGIVLVLLLQVTARTFTLPASIMLLNNCSPHPSVLGTIHGLGQSVSAALRTVGPVVGGWWYGYGLDIGTVTWGWWGVAFLSGFACATAMGMHEGSGHEIFLEGERDEAE
ncbi:membrane protein [Tolypocladium capitatum]|uniref:Membrane protein n=1 Tax=Tolypocladium capitatum TaxID=45235 RepID=A0A2K3QJ33_9HYPO|nr:membrane protein [Tolypocladium capitatum]